MTRSPVPPLVCTILCILTQLSLAEAGETKGTVYLKKENTRVDQTTEFSLGTMDGRVACVVACSAHEQCLSVNFRASDGQCMGIGKSFYSFGSSVSTQVGLQNFSPHATEVRDGEWILMFRAQRDVDTSATENRFKSAWDDNTLRSDDHLATLHPDCYSNMAATCTSFFRSKMMADWPDNVHQVRLVLYTAGSVSVEMVFDGVNSTRDSWYHTDTLVSSTWSDMRPSDPNNKLSILGQLDQRRMFTATTTADGLDCNQVGWLLVEVHYNNNCQFDEVTTVFDDGNLFKKPQFLYSGDATKINFKSDPYRQADVMAIFIKLK